MSKGKVRKDVEPQAIEANSSIFINLGEEKSIHDCVGLFNCLDLGKCSDYERCLRKYMKAEARNETLKF
jgi:hypothetical protein